MLSVVFDCPDFLVLDKPPGIPFHSSDDEVGVVERIREQLSSDQLFPVHRLDRVTSGAMLFAKNQSTNQILSSLFQERKIEKTYLAVSDRKPKKKQGKIVGDMTKSRGGSYKLLHSKDNPAITRFISQPIAFDGQKLYRFELKPKTGKTHQLRVALKAMGSPILGDARYGGTEAQRCYLHAYRLQFVFKEKTYDIIVSPNALDKQGLFEKFSEP